MAKISSAHLNLIADSLRLLPEQINDLLQQTKKFQLPKNYKNFTNIIIAGMGGSNLNGRIIKAIFSQNLKLPLIINADYELPNFVNKQSLVIVSSFSGNTEEAISAYKEAQHKKAKIIVFTSKQEHNTLSRLAKKDKIPCLEISSEKNPSQQPRLNLGYALFALIVILQKTKLLKINLKYLQNANIFLEKLNKKLWPNKSNNIASKLAHQVFEKNIIIITGNFLQGNAHTLRNQLAENSKNFATYLTLPDLNHYALEGLAYPKNNNLIFLCFDSILDSPRVQTRNYLTKQIIKKNKLPVINYKLKGKTKLEQSLEMLALGSWLSFYLAELNQVDPFLIPWVDWFKKKLK